MSLGPDLDWLDWWSLNAYEYFGPLGRRGPVTVSDDGFLPRSGPASRRIEAERAAAIEAVRRSMGDHDPRVRLSAALTAGRICDPTLRPVLLGLLEDSNPSVRRAAIAGLGLSGSEEDVPLLLRLGSEKKAGSRRTLEERDMAFLSLGIAARRGITDRYAVPLRAFLAEASSNDRRLLGPSAATSIGLASDPSSLDELTQIARDEKAAAPLRARALWAFRTTRALPRRPVAVGCLRDHDPDVRRAAALALGRLGEGTESETVEALRAAVESDGDTAVRAFALLSMGEVGGPAAKRELLERVARGRQLIRPWAAIGAGLLARKSPDPEVGRVLARALAEERNRDTRAAISLAIGLSRTREGRGEVRRLVLEGENSRERAFASIAVALGADEEGREFLRRAVREIPNPSVRASAGLALAAFGDSADAPELASLYAASADPGPLGTAALALAWHGSPEAFEALRRDAETAGQAERRAIALLALGLAVTPGRVPSSVVATAGWNYLASLEAAHAAALLWM